MKEVFFKLFRAVVNKNAMINDYYVVREGRVEWSMWFKRILRDFEQLDNEYGLAILRVYSQLNHYYLYWKTRAQTFNIHSSLVWNRLVLPRV